MNVGIVHKTLFAGLEAVLSERDRLILWLPVCIGLGIGVYFYLPMEPPLWLGGLGLVCAAAGAWWMGSRHLEQSPDPEQSVRRQVAVLAAIGLAAMALGFSVVQWRTALVATPMLSERLGPTTVTGRVVRVERFTTAGRITLERLRVKRLAPAKTPERVRLRVNGKAPLPIAGDWITARAVLNAPPAPAIPGAYDFQRRAYFEKLGAVGFSFGAVEILEGADPDASAWSYSLMLSQLRQRLSARIRDGLGGAVGAIAAALMVGDRGSIPPSVLQDIRDSGLAHLLAISGLHIGLVTGILFVGLRSLLALFPPIALRYPIKKWAAGVAIIGAFSYAQIAGATVPTQRAFLMVGLVLLAMMFDRRGLSVRLVAWAATVILLIHPESLLGASFQLSFAAVTALIAVYEIHRHHRDRSVSRTPGVFSRLLFYIGGVSLTTLVAGLATAPYAIYHFNRFAVYSLAANVIAVPLTALWIMPWAVVAFLLMPFGMEGVALAPMGWGIDAVMTVAHWVAGWPSAVTVLPSMPIWGITAVTLGGLWLCLWQRRWRFAGVPVMVLGMVSILWVRPPDVMVDGDARLMAVMTEDGQMVVSKPRTASFNRKVWLRRAGLDDDAFATWPKPASHVRTPISCDVNGCLYQGTHHRVSFVLREAALLEDCWSSDVIVSVVPVRRKCSQARVVIDRFDLWRNGAHAIWLPKTDREKDIQEAGDGRGSGKIRVESVQESRGHRPWVIRRETSRR